MTVAVTRPLEEALSGILGLRRDPHPHRPRLGGAEPRLPSQRRHAVRAEPGAGPAGRGCGARLPDGLDLSAERLTPSVFPMLQYELTGADPLVLRDLAELTVRPRLAGLPDVGEIEVARRAGPRDQRAARPGPPRRQQRRAWTRSPRRSARTDQAAAAGRTDRDYRQYAIVVSGLTNTPEAVGRVVVPRERRRGRCAWPTWAP